MEPVEPMERRPKSAGGPPAMSAQRENVVGGRAFLKESRIHNTICLFAINRQLIWPCKSQKASIGNGLRCRRSLLF